MKNVQVRFSDEVYGGLKRIADEEGISLSDVLKRSIQLYGILRGYQREGKDLAIVDQSGALYARLIIPGITAEASAREGTEGKRREPGSPTETTLTPFTPAHEVAEKLRGLTWPDPDFANDVEKAVKNQPLMEEPRWPA